MSAESSSSSSPSKSSKKQKLEPYKFPLDQSPVALFTAAQPAVYNPTCPVPFPKFQELGLGAGQQYTIPKGKVHEVYAALCASSRYRQAPLLVDVNAGSRGEVGDVIIYQEEWVKDEKTPE